jgi:hypothetical protein
VVVNGDGTTNTITGIVERNGNYWLENVPLNGTNQISIQATDAAGNVTQTNFIVKPSSRLLTVDSTPTGDALWQPSGTVSGRVSNPDAVVTVNGVQATVNDEADGDGYYSWSADGVPNYGEGTATFDVTANDATSTNQVNVAKERDCYVTVTFHEGSETIMTTNANGTWSSLDYGRGYSANAQTNGDGWVLNYDGSYGIDRKNGNADGGSHETTSFQWKGQAPGTESRNYVWTYSDANGSNGTTNQDFSDPDGSIRTQELQDLWRPGSAAYLGFGPLYIRHYYAKAVNLQWAGNDGSVTTLKIPKARTTVKLWTGGKSQVGRKSLFCLQPTAKGLEQAVTPGTWSLCLTPAVTASSLQVAGKQPGADGRLWLALEDNGEQDITITAPVTHYDAEVQVTKYPTYIDANGANLETNTPEFCVGQTVRFELKGLPTGNIVDMKGQWDLPGKYVNEEYLYHSNSYNDCNSYRINNDLLQNTNAVQCWYVNQPGGMVSVGLNLKFDNGQTASIARNGNFTLFRPSLYLDNMCGLLVGTVSITNPCLYITNHNNSVLSLGDSQGGFARFWVSYQGNPGDNFRYLQIVQTYRKSGDDTPLDSGAGWWYDYSLEKLGTIPVAGSDGVGKVQQFDPPGLALKAPKTTVNDVFHTYFQYQPASGGIWVTLGCVYWSWADTATYTNGQWNVSAGTISAPNYQGSDNFPLWDDATYNHVPHPN